MADLNRLSFELIIFDCDGVLVDSEPIYASMLMDTFAQGGLILPYEQVVENCTGKSVKSNIEFAQRLVGRSFASDFADLEAKSRDEFRRRLKPVNGIVEALDDLKQEICVASSSGHERIRFLLELAGLSSRCGDKIFSATEVMHGKPKPDLFLHAAHKMNCLPVNTAVIEDSLAGVEAGVAAGMTVFAFTGTFAKDKLKKAGAHIVFSEMKLLPALLQSYQQETPVLMDKSEGPANSFIQDLLREDISEVLAGLSPRT